VDADELSTVAANANSGLADDLGALGDCADVVARVCAIAVPKLVAGGDGELPNLFRRDLIGAHDDQRQNSPLPPRSRQLPVPCASAEPAVGLGLYLCLDLRWVRLCRVRDRRLRPLYRWLAGQRTAHASFVLDALEQALHDRRPVHRGGLVHYSDRGSQYVSIKYTERLPRRSRHRTIGRQCR
jgi:transposase InsO family protein